MNTYTSITQATAEKIRITNELDDHRNSSKKREEELLLELNKASAAIAVAAEGHDLERIALAESVLRVRGDYAKAGRDRASVISDAITEIATGTKACYQSLWSGSLGTKDYAHWHGQRSDHDRGYGPKHGSLIFQISLHESVIKRDDRALTDSERDACIYYLMNLERIQAARKEAA